MAVPEDLCPQLDCKAILSQDTVQQFPDSKRILVRRTFTPDGGLGDGTSPGPTLVGTEALQCPARWPNLVLAVTGTCFCTCNTQNVETLNATYQLIRRVTAVNRFPGQFVVQAVPGTGRPVDVSTRAPASCRKAYIGWLWMVQWMACDTAQCTASIIGVS